MSTVLAHSQIRKGSQHSNKNTVSITDSVVAFINKYPSESFDARTVANRLGVTKKQASAALARTSSWRGGYRIRRAAYALFTARNNFEVPVSEKPIVQLGAAVLKVETLEQKIAAHDMARNALLEERKQINIEIDTLEAKLVRINNSLGGLKI